MKEYLKKLCKYATLTMLVFTFSLYLWPLLSSPVLAQETEQECIDSGREWVVIGSDAGIPQYACRDEGAGNDTGNLFTPPEPESDGTVTCGVNDDGEEIRVAIDVGCDESASNPILGYLSGIINFLAAGVGIVVVVMIIAAAIEYISARGNPQKVEDAKRRITNAIIALISFIFMYAILQWLVPGGVFGPGSGPPPAGEENCNPSIEECLN